MKVVSWFRKQLDKGKLDQFCPIYLSYHQLKIIFKVSFWNFVKRTQFILKSDPFLEK
jgi:hypothetical protein